MRDAGWAAPTVLEVLSKKSFPSLVAGIAESATKPRGAISAALVAHLRDIAGNPFRPATFSPEMAD